jgi:hypothetical protein
MPDSAIRLRYSSTSENPLVALAQLALDDFELLAQIILPLRVAEFLLHAVADALLQFNDFQFVAQEVYQRLQTLLNRHSLQHLLLVGKAHGREVGNRVGEAPRLLHVRDGGDDFGRDTVLLRSDFFEHFDGGAHQRLDVRGERRFTRGNRLDLCQQVRLVRFERDEARPLQPAKHNAHRVVGRMDGLQNLGDHSHLKQIASVGSSMVTSRWVTSSISLLNDSRAASTAWSDFSRPTSTGASVLGK